MAMSEHHRTGNPTDDPGLARLYREAAREEPPVHLDAAILAAAHRGVGARPQLLGSAWLGSWRLPVSVAAVVALSVSLVTLMFDEGGNQLTAPPLRTAESPAKSGMKRDAAALPATPAETPSPTTKPAPGMGAVGTRLEAQEGHPPGKTIAKEVKRGDTGTAQRAAPQPFPAPPPSGTVEPHAAKAIAPPLRDGARPPPATAMDLPPVASKSPADLASPPPVVVEEKQVEGATAPLMRGRAAPEVAGSAGRPALQKSALIREYENAAPEKWLDKITELRRDGKTAEADGMLAEFKKRFPEHPLPATLR